MGFRFRRTLKILPGVRLNFSRSGVSATAGVRGANVTLGKKGTYANVGLPGSGVSYRTKVGPGLDEALDDAGHREVPARKKSILPALIAGALLIGGGALALNALQKPAAPPAPVHAALAPVQKLPVRETVQIAKHTATIRAEASRKSDKLGIAHQGDEFVVFARKGVWLQIGHDIPEGWIAASATH